METMGFPDSTSGKELTYVIMFKNRGVFLVSWVLSGGLCAAVTNFHKIFYVLYIDNGLLRYYICTRF